jgi:cytidylate kinase
MTVVAIDGPAGAGKSSVARAVSIRLGLRYLDTGAMYRAVALAALDRGIDPNDADAVHGLVEALDLRIEKDSISVDGTDVTARIRGAEVTGAAARVARHEAVRRALVRLQRQIASGGQVVMEGRDIGSAVLPDADVKVFLTASLEERARRRCRQLGEEETDQRVAALVVSIDERDEADRSRAASPLVQADDAVVIDTTGLTEEQVVDRIAALATGDLT